MDELGGNLRKTRWASAPNAQSRKELNDKGRRELFLYVIPVHQTFLFWTVNSPKAMADNQLYAAVAGSLVGLRSACAR